MQDDSIKMIVLLTAFVVVVFIICFTVRGCYENKLHYEIEKIKMGCSK